MNEIKTIGEYDFTMIANLSNLMIFDIDGTLSDDIKFNLVSDEERENVSYDKLFARRLSDIGQITCMKYLSGRMKKYQELTDGQLRKNRFPRGELILYDGDENDPNFVESMNKWKLEALETLLDHHKRVAYVDNDLDFLHKIEKFIKTQSVLYNIGFKRQLAIIILGYNIHERI